ncbi:hypothetical protein AB0B25_19055 [Nocardia sp. NPDC049190]|uniref:hypothetical protein n=1 Tax=Nocardia sp. NPDC049190 TaxID=3155650 RepID=UPI0033C20D1E
MSDVSQIKQSLHVQRDRHDLAVSNLIKKDPLEVGDHLAELRQFLCTFHGNKLVYADRQLEPIYVGQRVAQDLRRCIQRVISDRIGYAVLAMALEFLDPNHDVADFVDNRVACHGIGTSLDQIYSWEGPRNYWLSGDSARIAAALEAVLIDSFSEALQTFPEDHLATLHHHNKVLTEEFGAISQAIYRQESESGRYDAESLSKEPYSEKISVPFRNRSAAFWSNVGMVPDRTNSGLQPDLFKQLPSNYIGFGALGATTLEAAMAALADAHVPVDRWFDIMIAANAEFSVTAAVADSVGSAINYTDREPNPFGVESGEGGWRLTYRRAGYAVPAEKIARCAHIQLGKDSSGDGEIMYGRGRCPSNEALEPSPHEQQLCVRISDRLEKLLGAGYPSHLSHITSANSVALLTAVLGGRLLMAGRISPLRPGHTLANLPQLLTKDEELQFKQRAASSR